MNISQRKIKPCFSDQLEGAILSQLYYFLIILSFRDNVHQIIELSWNHEVIRVIQVFIDSTNVEKLLVCFCKRGWEQFKGLFPRWLTI